MSSGTGAVGIFVLLAGAALFFVGAWDGYQTIQFQTTRTFPERAVIKMAVGMAVGGLGAYLAWWATSPPGAPARNYDKRR